MYSNTTHNIKVIVEPIFNDRLSLEDDNKFVWDYSVSVENSSNERIKIIERTWEIIDSSGQKTVIKGEGIIGMQPIIEAGGCFSYSSYTVIKNSSGFMKGYYIAEKEDGSQLEIVIPLFPLDVPFEIQTVH